MTDHADEARADPVADPSRLTEADWRARLTPEQYHVLREKGTERPGTGRYEHWKKAGTYLCAGCGHALFGSDAKYDSGSGWPSFHSPLEEASVETRPDKGLFTTRTEVLCPRCGGHLGHVFADGPPPTGQRYCINSAALRFRKAE